MRVGAAIWPGPSFKKQLISHCQHEVQGLDPWHWVGGEGFTCHQYAMAHILYRCAPHLLIPVREKMRTNKNLRGLFYVLCLNLISKGLISFRQNKGFTYDSLARKDGWKLPEDFNITREQMVRLGELLEERIVSGGFLLVEKDFHGEAICLSPYDEKQVEMKSKTYTLDLWRIGGFAAWFDRVNRERDYQYDQLLLSDMINNLQEPTRLAGMQELDALLTRMPIEKIIEQAEEEYPRFRDRYYG